VIDVDHRRLVADRHALLVAEENLPPPSNSQATPPSSAFRALTAVRRAGI
jgi:hypothetical protein